LNVGHITLKGTVYEFHSEMDYCYRRLALLIVYAVWKDVEKHTGGGFITGFLRGAIVFGGAYYLYKWAKNENHGTVNFFV
jgi:hypothetical protein